jgi:hypothetical protein
LCTYTDISDEDHLNTDITFIKLKLKQHQNEWRVCKKKSANLCKQFLVEHAEMMAEKMHTNKEKAIKAITRAEESHLTFKKNREVMGRTTIPLTQVDILSDPLNPKSPLVTVFKKKQ